MEEKIGGEALVEGGRGHGGEGGDGKNESHFLFIAFVFAVIISKD